MPGMSSGQAILTENSRLAQVRYALPVSVRLPIVAAAMIFIAAVASTQTAIYLMAQQADRQLEAMGKVYLDGLSAALLPYVRVNDTAAIKSTLHQALNFHEGIVDRQLALVRPGVADVIEVSRDSLEQVDALPPNVFETSDGLLHGEGSIWIWRSLGGEDSSKGTVVASLDVSPFEAARSTYLWLLIVLDLVFSGTCAVIGYFMVRRVQRPVATIARHLQEAAGGTVLRVADGEIPANDSKAAEMMRAFNSMAGAMAEREKLIDYMAAQQRQADLGRLAATIAHEVRNPLGGMKTALGTLKRFGNERQPREEAVTFLERGVQALERVVTATLEGYRSRPDWRALSRQDFDDLRFLVAADAEARGVSVILDLAMDDKVPVPALEVRQIVLNLLLNAVRASDAGSVVMLLARVAAGELTIVIEDKGKGFDREVLRSIETGNTPSGSGIGVSVVVRLVEQLNGRVSIDSRPEAGTRVDLVFPLVDESHHHD